MISPDQEASPKSKGFYIGSQWLSQNIFIAPMTGISDLPFRIMAQKLGTDYVPTEMVACQELEKGRADVVRKAQLGDHKGLKVVQLVGRDPHYIARGAQLATDAGAQIIDLNFGCPAKEVTGQLCGSALMRDLDQAQRIMSAALCHTHLPVTVKMRLGWDDQSINAPQLAQSAQDLGIAAITVHGRTRQQFYKGKADWLKIAEVKKSLNIPLIVNGDIIDPESAKQALEQSGAQALMIGRGIYGRPWLPQRLMADHDLATPMDLSDIFNLIIEHMELSLSFYGAINGLKMFKKHLGWYVENTPYHPDPSQRRQDKAFLCRLDEPSLITSELKTRFVS